MIRTSQPSKSRPSASDPSHSAATAAIKLPRWFIPTTSADDPWHEVEINRVLAYERWDAGWKARLGALAGLTLAEFRWRHVEGGGRYWRICFARHWPHHSCWSWLFEFGPQRGKPWEYRRFWAWRSYGGQCTVRLFWLLDFHWQRQRYDYMPAAPFAAQAPDIYPLHEGEARTRVW